MRTLVLETSTAEGSLALLEGGEVVETCAFRAERGHNSKIYGPLERLLTHAPLAEGKGLQRVVVGTGPGSYTGVRIAIAMAQALALSYGAELVGVSSFIGAEAANEQMPYWVVGDARRQSWYRAEVAEGQLVRPVVVETRAEWELAVSSALAQGMPVYTFDERLPLEGVRRDRPVAVQLGQRSKREKSAEGPVEPYYLAAPYITQPKAS